MTWMVAVGGGIYSLQPLSSRWLSLLLMGTPDSSMVHRTLYCSLSGECHVSRPLGFGAVDCWSPLSSCGTGQSDSTPYSPVCSDFAVLTSDFYIVHYSLFVAVDHWAKLTVALLAHQTGQWIIAKWLWEKPESGQFARCLSLGTGQCPMCHWQHQCLSLLQTCRVLQLIFFVGLCWTLCTWDKWQLGKLVSPCGLWWTSNTKIDYRKWLSSFLFQSPPFGDWCQHKPKQI
jgi:hypothetical protein